VVPGWEFAATYEAANEVGGDFYDFFRLPESPQHVGFVIADVTGKGVPAALMMAFCRTVIRSEAARSFSPGQVLERANELILQDNRTQLLLSAFYGLLDTHTGRLAYANGGHDHPLWTRAATGECRTLESRGMVLGAFAFLPIDERAIIVEPGDRLVFYTDGVTEARAPDGGMFGEDRLQAVIATEAALNADETVRRVVASVKAFAQGTPPADDLTLLVIRRGPAA
jgi:sigma-B regulation protein RsbU (phosphoserine phosphatase)